VLHVQGGVCFGHHEHCHVLLHCGAGSLDLEEEYYCCGLSLLSQVWRLLAVMRCGFHGFMI